jgi:hypothetical protein
MDIKELPKKIWFGLLAFIGGGVALISPFLNTLEAAKTLTLNDRLLLICAILLMLFGICWFAFWMAQYLGYRNGTKNLPYVKDFKKTIISGILYYHDRSSCPSMADELAKTKTVYALWHIGGQAKTSNIYHKGIVKKLLFINPALNLKDPIKSYIKKYFDGEKPEDSVEYLHGHIKLCRKYGGEVYGINQIPPYLITISNPNSVDSWIKLEEFDLSKSYKERHSYKILRISHKFLYDQLFRYFMYLWDEKKVELK